MIKYTKIENRKNEKNWMLLIHCICYDSKIFENIIPILGQKYNLILIDLPGHGKCANFKNKFTLVNVIDEIYNILKKENINSITLLGLSLGSLVGTEFLAKYEMYVKKAIFFGVPYSLSNSILNNAFVIFSKVSNLLPTRIYLKLFLNVILPESKIYNDIKNEMFVNGMKMDKKLLKNWLCIMGKNLNYDISKIQHTNAKKIYIMGKNDKVFLSGAKRVLRNLKNYEYYELENVGHLVHIEDEGRFCKICLE